MYNVIYVDCGNCEGTGRQLGPYDAERRCKMCDGLGYTWEEDDVE